LTPGRPRPYLTGESTDQEQAGRQDARAQEAYGIHSAVNKVLVINREITPGRITVVLVDEVLGF